MAPKRFLLISSLCLLVPVTTAFGRSQPTLPFWTEKTTYVEGERLYAVGVSAGLTEQTLAREDAFRRAQIELQNFLQLSDLSGLVIETQMNFDSESGEGKWKSYRLAWVDYRKALELKRQAITSQSQAVRHQTQLLQERIQTLEPLLEEQKSALEKLRTLEKQADAATKDLQARLKMAKPASDALKSRIEARTLLTCLVAPGMRESEVQSLLGQPDSIHANGRTWIYGKSSLMFLQKKVRGVLNYSECRQANASRVAADAVSPKDAKEIL